MELKGRKFCLRLDESARSKENCWGGSEYYQYQYTAYWWEGLGEIIIDSQKIIFRFSTEELERDNMPLEEYLNFFGWWGGARYYQQEIVSPEIMTDDLCEQIIQELNIYKQKYPDTILSYVQIKWKRPEDVTRLLEKGALADCDGQRQLALESS